MPTMSPSADQVVQSYVETNQFIGSVLLARGGEVLLSKGYGFANIEWKIPNTPTTRFRIASLTKQFTAACILLLSERGQIDLGHVVKRYLPDAPATWDKITILHLLTHTSGIANYTGLPEFAKLMPFAITPQEILGLVRDRPTDFEAGERFSYSNSGYVLLGHLIEKISGRRYGEFVQENIFTPLGMTDSGYDSNEAIIERRAAGYSLGATGFANADYIHMSVPHAAGSLYSTTEGLFKWQTGLYGGRLLTAASLERMTTPFKDDHAFGLMVRNLDGLRHLWCVGGINGFAGSMAWYPDSKVVVVVLANLSGWGTESIYPQLALAGHGRSLQLASPK
jgi:CubicO group peptidase (beta-lactamase class C family)